MYITHTDHLNSSSVVTNKNGSILELTDYYPYGEQRVHDTYNGFDDRKGYIGKDYDINTELSYLEARYYNGKRGQFIGQDPMFWILPQELLIDPQQQNSYSYARGNPINGKDPSGKIVELVAKSI